MKNKSPHLSQFAEKSNFRQISLIFSLILPFILVIITLNKGFFTLWYDPARDLLSAWDNLHKFTFLGPPAGIPGLFYGPYWIWLLSFGMIFSKDPLIITFIIAAIPYLFLLPILWFKVNRTNKFYASLIGLLLFMLTNGLTYATALWNPYPAPLLTLCVLYLLLQFSTETVKQKIMLKLILVGFFAGLVINFHISFGIAIGLGVGIYLFIHALRLLYKSQNKKSIILSSCMNFISYIVGLLVAFIPTLIFESRHGFHQTQTLLHTLFQYGNVVTIKGLSKEEVAVEFIKNFERILHVTHPLGYYILTILFGIFIYLLIKKKISCNQVEQKMILIWLSLFGSILFVFFTAKNPIWNYHFIGVDLLITLLITFFIAKIPKLIFLALLWTCVIVGMTFTQYYLKLQSNQISEFYAKKEVVLKIANDAKQSPYTVYAYNDAIYTYDYAYLFRWIAKKEVAFDPGQEKQTNSIYLIIPKNTSDKIEDFVEFRGQNKLYNQTAKWSIGENIIIKKMKK